jgi:hypothetical protein
MMKVLMFAILAAAAWARPPEFKTLSSKSSFPLDCHFKAPGFPGRLRMSGVGEIQLLVDGHECRMSVERVTQGTMTAPRTVSLHFHKLADCEPALDADLTKKLTDRLELELTYKSLSFWVQDDERAVNCEILRYDRRETGRLVKDFTQKTGTGKDAERNLEPPKAAR